MSKQDVFPDSVARGEDAGVQLRQAGAAPCEADLQDEVRKLQGERSLLEAELVEAHAKIKMLEGQHAQLNKRLDTMEEMIRTALV